MDSVVVIEILNIKNERCAIGLFDVCSSGRAEVMTMG